VTAQLLHEGPVHLVLNALGLVALVGLLERQLGTTRSALVLMGSGAGAMLGCAIASYDSVVGASGLVMGAAGALLALELLRPDLLPAPWRLPRRLFVAALVADAVLLLFVPRVAHGAHLGGFLAGGAFAFALAPGSPASFAVGPALRAASLVSLALLLASLGVLARSAANPGLVAARQGERLLSDERASAQLLNNYAWTIAVSAHPSEQQLRVALALARRAVRETRRSDPNLLDTLAEVYFQSGRADDAVATIDEAIELAPGEAYFREQRRRFLGERAADDRPEPPDLPPGEPAEPWPLPEQPDPDAEPPGLRVSAPARGARGRYGVSCSPSSGTCTRPRKPPSSTTSWYWEAKGGGGRSLVSTTLRTPARSARAPIASSRGCASASRSSTSMPGRPASRARSSEAP
jgi:tetratricopeptide (TPR) repeat protein